MQGIEDCSVHLMHQTNSTVRPGEYVHKEAEGEEENREKQEEDEHKEEKEGSMWKRGWGK